MVNWSKHFIAVIDRLIETLSLPSAGTPNERSKDLEMFWSRIVTYVPHGSGGQKYISGWARVLVPGGSTTSSRNTSTSSTHAHLL